MLTLDIPEHAKQHDRITIGGTLIDEFTTPVSGADVIISIYRRIDDNNDGVQQINANVDTSDLELVTELTVTTDADGAFSESYKFLETGNYVIIASYAESNLYLEAYLLLLHKFF